MTTLPVQSRYTPAEYLAIERASEIRSEYIDGYIVAMTGASREHNLITTNISRTLGNQVEDRPCEVYASDMRVKAENKGSTYTYPDVVVVCGEPEFEDAESDTLLNPVLIVEVLSPSTENYDRGKKFARYREIASLQEYLLIAQDEAWVEHFVRQDETWVLRELNSLDGVLQLPSIGCSLPGSAIYQKVHFPPAAV